MGQFKKKPWWFRDAYAGYSPAEIVGTILVPAFGLLGLWHLMG